MTRKKLRTPVVKMTPWSWHNSHGYQGQLARMVRWHERAQAAREPDEIEDYLFSFFQVCHHLREWLPAQRFPPPTVKAFVERHVEFGICRDLCNLTKHMDLRDPPATGAQPSIARVYVPDGRGWFGPDAALVVLVEASERPVDLMELSHCCLALWLDFVGEDALGTN